MDELLLLLFKRRADAKPLRITTSEIGEVLGMSQQNASRRLAELEKGGFIGRSNEGIRLTKKSIGEVARLYSMLQNIFDEDKKAMELEGTVVSGLGEGRYYLSMNGYKAQIKNKLGFLPFPGTLNIRLPKDEMWKKKAILQSDPVIIDGFEDKDRSYGDLFAYKCRIEGLGDECALIFPLRTHHGEDVIELISSANIKKRLAVKDGDNILVMV
jgi:riboflavin kinase